MSMKSLLSSKDWISEYKQSHVDVDPKAVFGSSSTTSTCSNTAAVALADAHAHASASSAASATANSANQKTDWHGEYYNLFSKHLTGGSSMKQQRPSIDKPLPPHVVTRAFMRSRSLSGGSSIGSRASSITLKGDTFDAIQPSVDFSSLITPSMDAALNSMHQTTSDKSILLTSADLVASMVSGIPPVDADAEATSGPIPMNVEDEQKQPATTTTSIGALDTDVAMILALSKKEKAEQAKKNQMQSRQKQQRVRSRRSREPDVKVFVEPLDTDVLLGRGGRSNHHPGNITYRDHVGTLREWYRSSEKNAKTDLSQILVDWVHDKQLGRFLKLDDAANQWYVVTNIVARRKASQFQLWSTCFCDNRNRNGRTDTHLVTILNLQVVKKSVKHILRPNSPGDITEGTNGGAPDCLLMRSSHQAALSSRYSHQQLEGVPRVVDQLPVTPLD